MPRFAIDPRRSRIWIEARSSLHPIRSESTGLEGFFEADVLGGGRVNLGVPPRAQLELPVERLSSGNPLYDREMRRRVDARRYPAISGTLAFMKEVDGDGSYLVGGDITFRGTTRSYEDTMTVAMVDDHTVRLEGQRTFDIREFGMEPPRILTLKVHPDVNVRIQIIASHDGGGA